MPAELQSVKKLMPRSSIRASASEFSRVSSLRVEQHAHHHQHHARCHGDRRVVVAEETKMPETDENASALRMKGTARPNE